MLGQSFTALMECLNTCKHFQHSHLRSRRCLLSTPDRCLLAPTSSSVRKEGGERDMHELNHNSTQLNQDTVQYITDAPKNQNTVHSLDKWVVIMVSMLNHFIYDRYFQHYLALLDGLFYHINIFITSSEQKLNRKITFLMN